MTHQEQDAFGLALLDHLEGSPPRHLTLQSDDGVSTEAMPPSWFFQTEASWVDWERSALEQAEGPVLDLGAGAGRASLFLQARGRAVTAVDRSPGAVEVCRRRGVSDVRLCDFVSDLPNDKRWRTILLLCGNLGLAGSWDASRDLLVRLNDVCAEGAVILADTVDPTVGADARTTAYQQRMTGGPVKTPRELAGAVTDETLSRFQA